MVADFFTPEAVEALPHVNHVVDSLINDIQEKGCSEGPVDLVEEFATLVNPKVIFALYGIPEKDANGLAKHSGALGGTSGTAGESGHTRLHGYLNGLIDERIQKAPSPQDDVISRLAEQYRAGNLERNEVNLVAFMIFVAGNSAIMSSVSLGILTLLQHPDQLNQIKEDPKLTKQAVEEILRYHTPSALNSRRVAIEGVKLGGKV